jgi:hypothetical protein
MSMMRAKDAQYLNSLEDAEQYPVARCAQGPGIYMYHRSTSAVVESMNAANCEMRAKTAVDPLNACLLLMKLKCKWFNKQRTKAWSSDSFLTPCDTVEYEEVFEGINALDFTITIVSQDKSFECRVCQNMMSRRHPPYGKGGSFEADGERIVFLGHVHAVWISVTRSHASTWRHWW